MKSGDTEWEGMSEPPPLKPGEVLLFRFKLTREHDVLDSATLALLETGEQERARRFIRPGHQRRFAIGGDVHSEAAAL